MEEKNRTRLNLKYCNFFYRLYRSIKYLNLITILLLLFILINFIFHYYNYTGYFFSLKISLILIFSAAILLFILPVKKINLARSIDRKLRLPETIQAAVEFEKSKHIFRDELLKRASVKLKSARPAGIFKIKYYHLLIVIPVLILSFYFQGYKLPDKFVFHDTDEQKNMVKLEGKDLAKQIEPDLASEKDLLKLMDGFKVTSLKMKKNKLTSYESVKKINQFKKKFIDYARTAKKKFTRQKDIIKDLAVEMIKNRYFSRVGENILNNKLNTAVNDLHRIAEDIKKGSVSLKDMKKYSEIFKRTAGKHKNDNSKLINTINRLNKVLHTGNRRQASSKLNELAELLSRYSDTVNNFKLAREMSKQAQISKHKLTFPEKFKNIDRNSLGSLLKNVSDNELADLFSEHGLNNLPENFTVDSNTMDKLTEYFQSHNSQANLKLSVSNGTGSYIFTNYNNKNSESLPDNSGYTGIGTGSTNKKGNYFKIKGALPDLDKLSANISHRVEDYKKLYKSSVHSGKPVKQKIKGQKQLQNLKDGSIIIYRSVNDGSRAKSDFGHILERGIYDAENAVTSDKIPDEYVDKVKKYYESFVPEK